MGYDRCKTCNDFHWDNVPCDPIHKVYDEEYMGDEPKEFHAHDAEAAAIKYARYYNDGDYALMNEEREIIVETPKGQKKTFTITAEPSVHYSATEIIK